MTPVDLVGYFLAGIAALWVFDRVWDSMYTRQKSQDDG